METLWLHGAGGASAPSLALTDRPVTVGRSGDLRLEDDALEKKHARFVRRDGRLFVAPLGRAGVAVGDQPISAESEVKPGDLVLLSASAAVFVAAGAEQVPSERARDAVGRLASDHRDRVLVRLLALPSAGLVEVVRDKLGTLPGARLRAVAGALRQVHKAVAGQPPDAPVHTLLERLLREATSDRPLPPTEAELREQERRRRHAAEAAAAAPPPIDEEADPEQSSGTGAPTRAWHLLPSPQDVGHGFSHGVPPIPAATWPRSPRDGAPMKHLGTLLVPAEYRVAGPERVAIALFQADDHTTRPVAGAPRHAGEACILADGIGGTYGLIWLDRQTFQKGQGHEVPDGITPSPPRPLALRARLGDPNVGLVIPDWDDDDASPYVKLGTPQWDALALSRYDFQTSRALAHFGGTSVACDNFARGLGPFYLGIEHAFGDANFGGGNAVLDLARQEIEFGS